MTTPNIEELIAVLEATNQFHDNADICTADVIAALQTQAERTGVSIHDETCYGCSEYYANKWESA